VPVGDLIELKFFLFLALIATAAEMRKILVLFSVFLMVLMTFGNYIDSRTHNDYKARKRDGKKLELVFSDEFETPGRSFRKGHDPVFEALFNPDNTNEGLEFCKLRFIG
jgi:hypothetical protein